MQWKKNIQLALYTAACLYKVKFFNLFLIVTLSSVCELFLVLFFLSASLITVIRFVGENLFVSCRSSLAVLASKIKTNNMQTKTKKSCAKIRKYFACPKKLSNFSMIKYFALKLNEKLVSKLGKKKLKKWHVL